MSSFIDDLEKSTQTLSGNLRNYFANKDAEDTKRAYYANIDKIMAEKPVVGYKQELDTNPAAVNQLAPQQRSMLDVGGETRQNYQPSSQNRTAQSYVSSIPAGTANDGANIMNQATAKYARQPLAQSPSPIAPPPTYRQVPVYGKPKSQLEAYLQSAVDSKGNVPPEALQTIQLLTAQEARTQSKPITLGAGEKAIEGNPNNPNYGQPIAEGLPKESTAAQTVDVEVPFTYPTGITGIKTIKYNAKDAKFVGGKWVANEGARPLHIQRQADPQAPKKTIGEILGGEFKTIRASEDYPLVLDEFIANTATMEKFMTGRNTSMPDKLQLLADITRRARSQGKNFDAGWSLAVQGLKKDILFGKTSDVLVGMDQLLGHLKTMENAFTNLRNKSIPYGNSITQFIAKNTGDGDVTAFNTAAKAVKTEAAAVFKAGAGRASPTTEEIKDWENVSTIADSPEQFGKFASTLGGLLGSRVSAIKKKALPVGKNFPEGFEFLSDSGKESLKRLNPEAYNKLYGESSDSSAATPAPSSTQKSEVIDAGNGITIKRKK